MMWPLLTVERAALPFFRLLQAAMEHGGHVRVCLHEHVALGGRERAIVLLVVIESVV